MISTFSFLFGLVIGSFLNVCIYRLPRGESVVAPGSHCPHCQHPIAAYDNIPLCSYLWLRGKCRHCHARISPRYLFVELATGLLFLFSYSLFGLSSEFAKQGVFGALLIVLTVTDWRERLLPDRVTFPGMALGLLFSLIVPVGDGAGFWLARLAGVEAIPPLGESLLDALLGALLGGGLLYLLGEVYFRLRHREGMGLGDVKMMVMVGCFLGPKLTLLTIFLASLVGAFVGVGLVLVLVSRPSYYRKVRRRFRHIPDLRLYFILISHKQARLKIPFGCLLGVAALVSATWGWQMLNWYRVFFP